MTPFATSRPVPVRIAIPEYLLALGIESALRGHAGLDVSLVDGEPIDAGEGVLITDYEHGVQLAHVGRSPARAALAALGHVLVLSGRDREHEIRLALEQGVSGFLPVSCSARELVDAVLALAQGLRYLSTTIASRMASSLGRETLTLREQQVLALLACGECNKQIARSMDIAIGTVKSHVKSVMYKLGASSRTKAICIANERGLIDVQVSGRLDQRRDRQGVLSVDLQIQHSAQLAGAVGPGVVGAALDDDAARLEQHFGIIKDQRHFALDNDAVVDGLRTVHHRMR
jgi:DNA-binding NarL/FixJ family response regulator